MVMRYMKAIGILFIFIGVFFISFIDGYYSAVKHIAYSLNTDAGKIKDTPKTIKAQFLHPHVSLWFNRFIDRSQDDYIERIKTMYPVYRLIRNILKKNGFDEEFVNLVWVESAFYLNAISRRKAVGPWQFMETTAKNLGLSTYGIDDRKDIYASTLAFINHFSYLYRRYNSLELALAAYNSGSGRVDNAVKKYKTRNFWELSRKKALPRETLNYVPKFLSIVRWSRENYYKILFIEEQKLETVYILSFTINNMKLIKKLINFTKSLSFAKIYNAHVKSYSFSKGQVMLNMLCNTADIEQISIFLNSNDSIEAKLVYVYFPEKIQHHFFYSAIAKSKARFEKLFSM